MIDEAMSKHYLDGNPLEIIWRASIGYAGFGISSLVCDFDYISWSEFEVSLKESITEPISLALFAGTRIRFQRNGINWKVNDIIFPESYFESRLR